MKIQKHFKVLGLRVTDKVTGFHGVATSLSFDLYGCIQFLVTPAAGEHGQQDNSGWYDAHRLTITDESPVMDLPYFDFETGPAEKPTIMRRQ